MEVQIPHRQLRGCADSQERGLSPRQSWGQQLKPWEWRDLWQDCVKGEEGRLSEFTFCNDLPQSISYCSGGILNKPSFTSGPLPKS